MDSNQPFTRANSNIITQLQHAMYLMVRNSVIQHSTKNVVEKAAVKPTKDEYMYLQKFFREELQESADRIYATLLNEIEGSIFKQIAEIEFLKNNSELGVNTADIIPQLTEEKRTQNLQLQKMIDDLNSQIAMQKNENEQLKQELSQVFSNY